MDQLDTMPMVPEEMEFYSGIGDEKSVGAEKSPMTIPTVPPVPDGENPFEDTDEPEADFFHCATDSNVCVRVCMPIPLNVWIFLNSDVAPSV